MFPILYGSQTGNGRHLAELLEKEFKGKFFILPIDNFKLYKINEFDLVIFIVSTYGDGQCPYNMSNFWDVLTTDFPKIFKFKYCVLCLGNSRYKKYNWCGKMLYNRLEQLGGKPLCKVLCDTQDKNGMYDGFNEFQKKIRDIIGNINEIGLSKSIEISDYEVDKIKYKAKVIKNELVSRKGYEKSIIEIVFDIPDYKGFEPGCCIGILPIKRYEEIRKYNLSEDEINWIENNINLYAQPHQDIFRDLSSLANKKIMKSKLEEISENYELYYSYVVLGKRNIFDIFYDFEISKVGFDFFKKLNKISTRYYSCSLINGKYHILVSILEYKTYLKNTRLGICSEYLKSLTGEIEVEITRSKLIFDSQKLLFFATGSGITLPRSVKHFYKNKEIKVFYGFRGYKDDLLCKDEFEKDEIYYAASVDDKKHIMDVFREHPVENIDDWAVFVCGNARVNKEINKLLFEIYNKEVNFQSETW